MPEPGVHYIDCVAPDCDGCLPSDTEVEAMSVGTLTKESMRRGLPHVRASTRRAAILSDADDYRARSAAARE